MANKRLFIPILAVLAAGVFLEDGPPVFAGELFHSGSAGNCDGCHATQGAQQAVGLAPLNAGDTDGTLPGAPGSGGMMLRGSDASSTCLFCHEAPAGGLQPQDHYVSTAQSALLPGVPPVQQTPAGDFSWLKKNYRWQGGESRGERHGHNIVAMDYRYDADATLRVAPGGSYPAASLSCTSCHDPHGNYRRNADGTITSGGLPIIASGSYSTSPDPGISGSVGSYRMLAGKGYQPKLLVGAVPFKADPPAAVAPSSYNRAEGVSDTRVAYGSGMSEWCQNCHSQIHDDGGGSGHSQHPVGDDAKLSMKVMVNYNSYLKSGDLSGTAGDSYTSLVPYEMGNNDYAQLKATANSDGSNLSGPAASTANVMCLTCHRAHASGWDNMMRWNMKSTFLVHDGRYPGTDNGAPPEYAQGRSEAETRKTFYDRPASRYASYQRSLCNKCHAED